MKPTIQDYLLCLFPLALIVIACLRMHRAKSGRFIRNYWSLKKAKAVEGLAAAFIILHHLTQMVTRYGVDNRGPITILQSMGIYFVAIFFFFSGYGLLYSYQNKKDYLDGFWLKRFPKIVVPFMLTNALYAITIGLDSERIKFIPEMISSLLGFTLINTNAWYVVEIILLYVVFYFAYRPRKQRVSREQVASEVESKENCTAEIVSADDNSTMVITKPVNEKLAFAIVTVFVLLMVVGSLLLCHDETRLNGHWFKGEWWYNTTILFVVGMAFAKGGEKLKKCLEKFYKVLLPFCTLAFFALFILEQNVTQKIGYYQEWEWHPGYLEKAITLLTQNAACISLVMLVLLVMMKCHFQNKALAFLGSVSFEVYLIHDLYRMYLGGDYLGTLTDPDLMEPFWLYFLVLLLSYPSAVLLQKIVVWILAFWKKYRVVENYAALTFEARMKLDHRRFILHTVYRIYAVLFVAFLILNVFGVYDSVIVPYQQFLKKKASITTSKVGDEVIFGNFELNYMEEGEEPIPWIVVAKEGNKRLLVANRAIYGKAFDPSQKNNQWNGAHIRKWMNDEMYNYIFSRQERKLIVQEGNVDKVFLLNEEEALSYFSSDEERQLQPSLTARDFGANVNIYNSQSWWWLRDAGADGKEKVVTAAGTIGEKPVNHGTGAVRPCVWVEVEANN